MAQFNAYLELVNLSALIDYCREHGRIVNFKKDEAFVMEGAKGRYFGIVESGYFKYVVLTAKGNYSVSGFAFEGEAVGDYHSLAIGGSSDVTILSGSDSAVRVVDILKLRKHILLFKATVV